MLSIALAGIAAAGASVIGFALSDQTHAPAPAAAVAGSIIAPPVPTLAPGPAAVSPQAGPERPPSEPTSVAIPAIGVSSVLQHLGLNSDATVAVPTRFGQAGWYDHSAACGQAGPLVILGHVDSYSGPAVFYRLGALHPGDTVTIHCADQTVQQFVLTGVREYPKDSFPTLQVYGPTATPTIRLITCGGSFDHATGHYLSNVVAFGRLEPST